MCAAQRIDAMRKAAMRRMLYAGLSRGWDAWAEMYEARHDARALLRSVESHTQVRGVGGAFTRWARNAIARKAALSQLSHAQQIAVVERLEAEIERMQREIKAVESERDALQQELVASGVGSEDLQRKLREQAAAESERRVELLGRQAMRRMMHEGLARGFLAWREMADARAYAMHALLRVARRLRAAVVWSFFLSWRAQTEAKYAVRELSELRRAPEHLKAALRTLQERVERISHESEVRLAAAEQERAVALERQRIELNGTLEERTALLEAAAKEERVELLRRRACRSLKYGGLAWAWEAWMEMYDARAVALSRLRQTANKLRTPELAFAFSEWSDLLHMVRERQRHSHVHQLEGCKSAVEARCTQLEHEVERVRAEVRVRRKLKHQRLSRRWSD